MKNNEVNIEENQYWQDKDFIPELLAQLPVHVFWKNKAGVYLGCNKAFYESLGFSCAEDIIGRTDYDFSSVTSESDIYRADDFAVIETKKPKLNIEEPQTTPSGKKIVLLTSKVPLMSKTGNVIGVLGIYTDITERKALEQREKDTLKALIEEKARLQSEEILRRSILVLTGSIVHDLRTPLTAALLKLDLLNREEEQLIESLSQHLTTNAVEEPLKSFLTLAKMRRDELKTILYEMNDYIDTTLNSMQRLVTGKLDQEDFIDCNIENCIYDVMEKYPFKNDQKNLVCLEKIEPFFFKGIPILFYRILFNLLGNALYQIEKNGQGKIYIRT